MAKQETTCDDILKELRAKQYRPVYYLMGEESYYIDLISDYIVDNVLTDTEKEFNLTVVYGADVDIATVINAAKRYPMMSERQVVVVKEAQAIRNMEELSYYLQKPLNSTILVLCHKHGVLDRRKKLAAEIEKVGVLFESKKVKDAQLPAFITSYMKRKGVDLDPKATSMLADFVGTDLSRLTGELEKLIITLPKGQTRVTPEQIERNIGISKDYNNFELRSAIVEKEVQRFNMEVYGIQEAEIFAMVPPAIPGLGATGGLQLQLEDRHNLGATEMQRAVETLMEHYRNYPALASVSSQYQANVPQYFLNIDRDKVQLMGIPLNSVFTALGYYMGEAYVNDYVQFGHIYQVKLGAGDRAQRVIDDVLKLSVPNASGEMVPFSSFTRVEEQLGMDQINRYNMYSTAAVTCNVAPGSSSGEGIRQMESLIKEHLGDEFGYEWTSVAYQETQAGTTTTVVFVMALLVAFLVLAAQYESWTSPVAAVMGLPVALLGAMLGCYVMGTPVSIYTQIGIILLVALSAKNGILIVEFARDFRAQGNSIRDAAFQAGHIRLRPILMTSLAFVFGVMPLLFATGAGAGSRIALGAAVVFGMALNTLLATVYIPNFYELMQKLQEKFSKKQ